jgi:hypothetical protein
MLPSTVRDECDGFVKQYEPMIANLIANKIKPHELCTKIGLCKKSFELAKVEEKLEVSELTLNTLSLENLEITESKGIENGMCTLRVCHAFAESLHSEKFNESK